MTARRAARAWTVVLAAAVAGVACDDQIKHIEQRTPLFNTMSWQPSVEAFEERARAPVPGTMPVGGERSYDLLAADTLLSSPLAATEAEAVRGAELYRQFCTPCHGAEGAGDGAAVGPNRIPDIPLLNIRGQLTRGYTDGYIWGMITNGRGLMPPYRRIPPEDRWLLVGHVRQLQAAALAEEEAAAAEAEAASEAEAAAAEAEAAETGESGSGETGAGGSE